MREEPQKPSSVIYKSEIVWIGRFRSKPHQPPFHCENQIGTGHLIVFPRTAVRIEPAGHLPVVANPTVTMLYNKGQVYRRAPISEEGDRCEWFGFDSQLLVEAMQSADPAIQDHPSHPFTHSHFRCDSQLYLHQRRIVEQLEQGDGCDLLWIEEQTLALLERIACSIVTQSAEPLNAHQIDLVHATQEMLSRQFNQQIKLCEIAQSLFTSPFHLARLFKRYTRQTIHQYREQLRLRTALELLPYYRERLADLALFLGYSNHSHFSSAFRRVYGLAPSVI